MWLSELRLVLPDQVVASGSIQIEDGIIQSIIEGPAPAPAFAMPGLTAIPGLIDLHGDMLEREINPRPKAEFPVDLSLIEVDKRLAGAGITTAFAAVSFHWHKKKTIRSEEWARSIISTINEFRPHLLTDHYVHARFEITNPEAGEVLRDLLEQDQVRLVSIMDHTPGQGQYRDIEQYVKFSIEWEKRQTGEERSEHEVRKIISEAQQRPKGWDAVRGIAALAQAHGITLMSHDDDTIEKVELMHSLGVDVSEFPVTRDAGIEAKNRGIHVLMGAPNAYRGQSTTDGNLSAIDAIRDGFVDTLASDYFPAAMIHSVFKMADEGILPLHDSIKLVTSNPAAALHMNDRGSLETGKRADITLVEETNPIRVRGVLREGAPIYWDAHMSSLSHPIQTELSAPVIA